MDIELVNLALSSVQKEVERAKSLYPERFNSLHEGYAVLLEETDELWDEIKKKKPDPEKVREEAIQVAAMAICIISELT